MLLLFFAMQILVLDFETEWTSQTFHLFKVQRHAGWVRKVFRESSGCSTDERKSHFLAFVPKTYGQLCQSHSRGCIFKDWRCDAQAVVDYLKQHDKDNKGALSTEELQAAIRGEVGLRWIAVKGSGRLDFSHDQIPWNFGSAKKWMEKWLLICLGILGFCRIFPYDFFRLKSDDLRPGSELSQEKLQVPSAGIPWNAAATRWNHFATCTMTLAHSVFGFSGRSISL